MKWLLHFENGAERDISSYDSITKEKKVLIHMDTIKTLPLSSSHIKIRGELGIKMVSCTGDYWNYERNAAARLPIKIRKFEESVAPRFLQDRVVIVMELRASLELNCSADTADPEPKYTWEVPMAQINGTSNQGSENISSSAKPFYEIVESKHNGSKMSVLKIARFAAGMSGEYACVAQNMRGQARKIFNVRDHREENLVWIYLGTSGGVITALTVVVIVLVWKFFSQRGRLTSMEIKLFEQGNVKELQFGNYAHENAQFLPYNKDFEVKWDDFQIYDDTKLGEGAYGVVFKGSLVGVRSRTVAIKTVKPGFDKSILLALLSELKVMIHLETNDNIVALIGACTEFLREGRVYILFEFCPMGCLESYLRKMDKKAFERRYMNCDLPTASNYNVLGYETSEFLHIKDTIIWTIQIASGMEYLQQKKVIHGDLASRNILLYYRCWDAEPEKRPDFQEIQNLFRNMIS
ncbi:unnamed protein product [Allacma fusca]|uniref:Uncharacterized protein n=1 Tax=Allacma fusca TaxID=39272 RepID=A0A8J2PLE6_9HEXA|nr:unnamed protein product [Allacma fusca]